MIDSCEGKKRKTNNTNQLGYRKRNRYYQTMRVDERIGNNVTDYQMCDDMLSGDTDPFGMYTGVPINKNEIPVQDADDL